MRRICASLNNHRSDNSSTSLMLPLNQPIASRASDLMGPEPRNDGAGIRLLDWT